MGKQANSGEDNPHSRNKHPFKSAYKQMKLPTSWITNSSADSSSLQPLSNTSQQRLNLTDRTNSDHNRKANTDGFLGVVTTEISSMSSSAPPSQQQQQQPDQMLQHSQQQFSQVQQQAQQHPPQQLQPYQYYAAPQPYYYQQFPSQYHQYSYPHYIPTSRPQPYPQSRPAPAPQSQAPPQLQRQPQESQTRQTQNRSQQQGETSNVRSEAPTPHDQLRRHHSPSDSATEQPSNKRPRITALTDTQFKQLTLNDPMVTTSDTREQDTDSTVDDDPPSLNAIPGPTKTLIPTHSVKSCIDIFDIKSQTGFPKNTAPSIKSTIPNYPQVFESFVDSTFENGGVTMSQQVFYEICSYVCGKGDAQIVFDTVSKALYANAKKLCDKLAPMASTNANFLAELISQWKQYLTILRMLNDIFSEINHHYLFKNTKFSSLVDFGRHVYLHTLSQDIKIRKRTISSTAYLISCQRCNQQADQNILMASLQLIYEHLPSYRTDFEEALRITTTSFYNERARDGMESMKTCSYVAYAINLILAEPTLKDDYKRYITRTCVSCSDIAIDELLVKHLPDIFRKGLGPFLASDRHPVLKALYRIVGQYDKASVIQSAFVHYIKTQCSLISNNTVRAHRDAPTDLSNGAPMDETSISVSFIDGLAKLKSMITHFLKNCFDDNPDFTHAMKESFEVAINKNSAASSRHIAYYMDWHLDRWEYIPSNDSHTPSQPSEALKRGIDLLRSLQAEETFKCHYKAGLSRRLLKNQTLHAIEKELHVVHLLQSECGIKFSSDLKLMIQDIKVSFGQIANFKDYLVRKKVKAHIDMQVSILSGETWSISPLDREVKLSAEMLAHQRRYTEFYHASQPRRKLTWMPSFSSCLLKASYPKCSIEIDATQYQTMILLLFNDTNILSLTMDDIARQLKMDKEAVKKALQQLSGPDTMFLNRRRSNETAFSIANRDVSDTDIFSYNTAFKSEHSSVDIQQVTMELSGTGFKNMVRQKLFDKGEKLQALIMRTLKQHRKLTSEELRDLITAPLKEGCPIFSIEGPLFQNHLDLLVKRDLIRRIDNDSFAYHDE